MSSAEKQNVDKIDVGYVARLTRLNLNDDEIEKFQGQLEQIVEYVGKIAQLDLTSVEPTSHPYPIENVFRKDEARDGLDRDAVLGNAPLTEDDQFIVPKIIE